MVLEGILNRPTKRKNVVFCDTNFVRQYYIDYFIHHRFQPIIRLYFLDYSDNSIIRQVGFSDVFKPIAKVGNKINTVIKWYYRVINKD
jgi:hypothetical protein